MAGLHIPIARWLRFWSRHLLLLNLALFALVWLLYGDLRLHGYGETYAARVDDLWLQDPESLDGSAPNIENFLLPAIAAAIAPLWRLAGREFTSDSFMLVAIAPYALFTLVVTWQMARARAGRIAAVGSGAAIYASGLVPYMTTWGGYVDGMSYLLLAPVLIWPQSFLVFVVAFVLQCLNHYLGAVALLLLAFVLHSLRALELPPREAWRSWLAAVAPRVVAGMVILYAFQWFWGAMYPDASRARLETALEKWEQPAQVLSEVLGPFPWTLLSALKLLIVPVVALMLARLPRRWLRAVALAAPLLAAATLTFIFVDITRVATMLMMPALLVVMQASVTKGMLTPGARRQLRRLVLATALLSLLIPNYYVNNGEIIIPRSRVISDFVAGLVP